MPEALFVFGASGHGKVVIDTNNYYPERDGVIPELEAEEVTTSELLQRHLPGSKVVKAFTDALALHRHWERDPDPVPA
mgnify:CR=1 FL=1